MRRSMIAPLTIGFSDADRAPSPASYPASLDQGMMVVHESKDANSVTATLKLPDFKKEDVQIDAHNNQLTVTGESRATSEHNEEGYAFLDKTEEIKASMDNGVLTVTFPKSAPESAPKKITISPKKETKLFSNFGCTPTGAQGSASALAVHQTMTYHEPTPANGGYDQRLLASAPKVTRAEKQGGYNVDLLEEGRRHGSASPPPNASPVSEHGGPSQDIIMPATATAYTSSKRPWYRTRAGIIGLVVLALVIIGAVIGGAVGGTRSNHHSSSVSSSQTQSSSAAPSSSAGSGSVGQGQAAGSVGVGQGQAFGVPSTSAPPAISSLNVG
ncbi:hypothetical protein EW146_g9229 [Bondarzewia mesenterica]|uniref:SHSP domain-containing protein n=1 Tax=Bondarzewia mesenterica TaxID=1095465 RepID=A0A4S4L7Z0_9AGAM|nr:hypothetical protein EW146_g9229 [Bondarzewia mesenterica]